MRTKVLIIEDDESIALGLQMNLEAEGFEVFVENDGESGLAHALREDVDLVILDLMLPKQNGFEVVRTLRDQGRAVPVIILTARGAESDKVMGLNLGAEDYVTKPFGLAELLARVNAVLRRRGPNEKVQATVESKGLSIDPKVREVRRDGALIPLTATEFDVLWCLVVCDGEVLSREEIQTRVWGPGHHGTVRTIDNFMLQLRAKLELDPSSPEHLLTVRGVGYRFAR